MMNDEFAVQIFEDRGIPARIFKRDVHGFALGLPMLNFDFYDLNLG